MDWWCNNSLTPFKVNSSLIIAGATRRHVINQSHIQAVCVAHQENHFRFSHLLHLTQMFLSDGKAEQSDTHTLCYTHADDYCAARDAELMMAHCLRHWPADLHHRWLDLTLFSLGLYIYFSSF